ncbi:unnamed protein product [Protopolystoma xenopodis]|uniref:Uncharacterized protein n=1 Tax=Protopolystoma xenopodis TaxID=117903 RepID=A0A3S5CM84_9PLAT|nr:unnamed protein product [Protopolystoma xenopodis]
MESGYTLTPRSVLAYQSILYPLTAPLSQLLTCLHSTRQNVCPFVVNLITFAIYSYPPLSIGLSDSRLQSESLDCLVDPFLIFLVDRFHSVPVPVCISLQTLFLKALEARTCRFTEQSA